MNSSIFLNLKSLLLLAFALILLLTIFRWNKGGQNFSFFITAGSDYVDSSKNVNNIIIQKGQGYDGQFFYKLALNPFNFNKEYQGVILDVPSYRIQRIAYPLAVWLLAFGNPSSIPFSLVLVNILSFLGIIFFTKKIIDHLNADKIYAILPFFLCGIYMSFSRDLSEVLELFFFVITVYYYLLNKNILFVIFSTLTIFTRETSMICLMPLALFKIFECKFHYKKIVLFIIPFLGFLLWKIFLLKHIENANMNQGYNHLGFPFKGIIDGFLFNLNFTDTKHSVEFLFWILLLIWNIFLIYFSLKAILKIKFNTNNSFAVFSLIYIFWLILACCFTQTIYVDDWGFVRVFSLWNLVGFLLIIKTQIKLTKSFLLFSIFLLSITFVRLIFRV